MVSLQRQQQKQQQYEEERIPINKIVLNLYHNERCSLKSYPLVA